MCYVLKAPVTHEPGTVFQYNNAGPYLLGILIERRTGCSLCEYLPPRLFEPLGMEIPQFELDPMGRCFGAGGMISKAAVRTCWQCRFLLPVCLWNLPKCAVFPLAAAKGEEGLSLFCVVFHPATEPAPHIL